MADARQKLDSRDFRETWMHEPSRPQHLHSTTIHADACLLKIVEGPHAGESFVLTGERYHVGRADWCDITLSNDMHISRHHCELTWQEAGLQVRDRGSRNGIRLEGARVYHGLFQPGQRLEMGDTCFSLQTEEHPRQIEVKYHDQSGRLVGSSDRMREIFSLLQRLGPSELPVLLHGETGTGKTTVARAIHEQSSRAGGPFVQVNCGSLSPSLIEAELFGYEKGAFTNAQKRYRGLFEQADGGTLFLDEIAELPKELQPKLLDVIERQELRRIGSEKEVSVDFRLISATHNELQAAIADGSFREDLYYRLAVAEIMVPPLRERPEDIPLLLESLLAQKKLSSPVEIPVETVRKLQGYLWPGNVRQLRNVLERGLLFFEGGLLAPQYIKLPKLDSQKASRTTPAMPPSPPRVSDAGELVLGMEADNGGLRGLHDMMAEVEKRILEEAIARCDGDMTQVREMLGISKSWTYKLLKKYELK